MAASLCGGMLPTSCFLLVGLTIAAGGFVAGTRAGLVYNTFR